MTNPADSWGFAPPSDGEEFPTLPPSSPQRQARGTEDGVQETLFDMAPDWRSAWWGMPSFDQCDARPAYRVTVNFLTREDLAEFGRRLGLRVSTKTDTAWFPPEGVDRPNAWEYVDES